MERGCMNEVENVYKACRKRAAQYNEALNSREKAAEMLGIAPSTLANHELGVTKNVPVDTVVMMADLYRAPELRNLYCKNECPIGRMRPLSTEIKGLQSITVRVLNSLDDDAIRSMKKRLLRIAEDGEITRDDQGDFDDIMEMMEKIATEISELRMLAEKYTERS